MNASQVKSAARECGFDLAGVSRAEPLADDNRRYLDWVERGMAGAMGYLTAAQNGFVVPEMLGWHASAIALVMVLIGGKDTVSGPVVGAAVLLIAEEVLQRTTEHWLIGVGLIIVVVVLAAPRGVVPFAARVAMPQWQRWRHG